MKITLLKLSRKKVVINRLGLQELADMIRHSPEDKRVYNLRLNYQFYTCLVCSSQQNASTIRRFRKD